MRDGFASEQPAPPLVADSYEIVPAECLSSACWPSDTVDGLPPLAPILLCDHAGNALPPGYGTLGLPTSQLTRHIAYDIGAAGVVRAMADALGAPAVLSRYSRLLIDLNRGRDDPTLVMRLSDGAIVPGNHPISAQEWDRRIGLYYAPYHRAIDWVIRRTRALGRTPVILSLHSFTEAWKGVPRPWHAGILWDQDARLSSLLLDALRTDPTLVVGDNQPYTGQLEGDCLDQHATRSGLAHALIEVRQDLITSHSGQQAWAERLGAIVARITADVGSKAHLQPLATAPHIRDRIGAPVTAAAVADRSSP